MKAPYKWYLYLIVISQVMWIQSHICNKNYAYESVLLLADLPMCTDLGMVYDLKVEDID